MYMSIYIYVYIHTYFYTIKQHVYVDQTGKNAYQSIHTHTDTHTL